MLNTWGFRCAHSPVGGSSSGQVLEVQRQTFCWNPGADRRKHVPSVLGLPSLPCPFPPSSHRALRNLLLKSSGTLQLQCTQLGGLEPLSLCTSSASEFASLLHRCYHCNSLVSVATSWVKFTHFWMH